MGIWAWLILLTWSAAIATAAKYAFSKPVTRRSIGTIHLPMG